MSYTDTFREFKFEFGEFSLTSIQPRIEAKCALHGHISRFLCARKNKISHSRFLAPRVGRNVPYMDTFRIQKLKQASIFCETRAREFQF